jgi:hypothetical protein
VLGVWRGQYLFNKDIKWPSVVIAQLALLIPPGDHSTARQLLRPHTRPIADVSRDFVCSTTPPALVVAPDVRAARPELKLYL